MRQESNLQGREARPGSSQVPVSQPDCASIADGGGLAPQPLWAHPGSSRGLRLGSFTIHERRTENSNPSGSPPSRLPSGAGTLAGSFSIAVGRLGYTEHPAESGRLERHGRSRALVSSEAQHPGWFTLPGTPGGICTLTPLPGHRFLRPARLHSATSAWSDRRDSNSRCDLGKVAC